MSDIQRRSEEAKPAVISAATEGVKRVEQMEVPRSEQLSETGKAVLEDIQKVAAVSRQIVEEKIQPAVIEAQAQVEKLEAKAGGSEVREGRQIVKEEAEELLRQLKESGEDFLKVGKLLAYSPNFRRLLLDFLGIIQEGLRAESEQSAVMLEGSRPAEASKELEELTARIHGKEMPKSSRPSSAMTEKLADRFVYFLREIHDVPEYKEAVAFLIEQSNKLEGLQTLSIVVKERADLTKEEQKIYEAAQQSEAIKLSIRLKVFVEHWLDASLDPLLQAANDLRQRLMADQDSQNVLFDFNKWLKSCMKEPQFMEHLDRRRAEFRSHLGVLRDRFRSEDYQGNVERLLEEINFLGERLRKDELSYRLTADLSDLMGHLFRDQAGNLTIKPELWTDLKAILPVLLKRMRFIEIPELVVKEESLDFRASGISISVGELAPKRIQAYFISDLAPPTSQEEEQLDLTKWQEEYDVENLVIVEASRIFADAKAIYFELEKRSFPALTDSGLADLTIHGEDGMRLRLVFGSRKIISTSEPAVEGQVLTTGAPQTPAGGFHLLHAKCAIDKLDLRLHSTKHDWMYMVLGPLIRRQLRLRIESEIEKFLVSGEFLQEMAKPEKLMEAVKTATL